MYPRESKSNNSGTHRTRLGRHSEPNRIYHVTTTTRHREPCFESFAAGRVVVGVLREQQAAKTTRTLAFVVMPDHLHWLFELGCKLTLGRAVNEIKSKSAIRVNRQVGRTGALWQKGYYERAIRAEDDLPAIARYIVANPVRSKLVRSVAEYSLWDAIWL